MHDVYMCAHMGHGIPEEVRGQLCRADSFLLGGIQGWCSGHQACVAITFKAGTSF